MHRSMVVIGTWCIQYKSTQNLQVAKAINDIYHFAIYMLLKLRDLPGSYDDFSEKFKVKVLILFRL